MKPRSETVDRLRSVLVMALGLSLAGCFGSDDRDRELATWIAEVKRRPPTPLEPVPQIKQIDNFIYDDAGRRNPFVLDERSAEAITQRPDSSGLAPDPSRRREPLEQYPLDALRMVGVLEQDEQRWGLILSPDGILHRVQVGNYLGRNDGKIVGISERGIQLIETVDEGAGDWRERQASLALRQ